MVSRDDDETLRFLDECIILFVHANPDGNDLVADWYMRNADPLKRSRWPACRGSIRSTSATTTTATSSRRRRPRPRTSTACSTTSGCRRFSTTITRAARPAPWSGRSPQRDPYNYNLDPLLILGLQALGTHMHQRLAAEGKPGATMASGGAYDGWWNGGIRNTGNFHNIIAILTETIGSPTPMRIPLVIAAADPESRSAVSRSRRRSGASGSRSTTRCRSTAR